MTIYIAGVDEAGRGPLIGSVFAAAVILPVSYNLPNLNDSKKISEKQRDTLTTQIKEQAISFAIAKANVDEIAKLNILHATMLAMSRAVKMLSTPPTRVLIDGNRIPQNLPYPAIAIVGGDKAEPAIMAASILAKTARDAEMYQLSQKYPQYLLHKNKGYGTKDHLNAIEKYGILPEHRKDFAPIKKWISNNNPSLFEDNKFN